MAAALLFVAVVVIVALAVCGRLPFSRVSWPSDAVDPRSLLRLRCDWFGLHAGSCEAPATRKLWRLFDL